jgi:hypothetical protein
VADDLLSRLRGMARPREPAAGPSAPATHRLAGLEADDLAHIVTILLQAADGEPIPTVRVWPVNRKRVRIERIEIDKEEIRLYIRPLTGGATASAGNAE